MDPVSIGLSLLKGAGQLLVRFWYVPVMVGIFFWADDRGYDRCQHEHEVAQANLNNLSRELDDMLQGQSDDWALGNFDDLRTWGAESKETVKYVTKIVRESPAYRPDCLRDQRVPDKNNALRSSFNARNASPPSGEVPGPTP